MHTGTLNFAGRLIEAQALHLDVDVGIAEEWEEVEEKMTAKR